MAYNPDFDKYRKQLIMTEHIYKVCFYIVVFYIIIDIINFGSSFMFSSSDMAIAAVFSGLLLPGAYVGMTLYSLKGKKNILLLIAPVFTGAAALIGGSLSTGIVNGFFTFINLVVAIVLILTNKLYNELSEKEGFPYFSELIEHNKEEKKKFEENHFEKRYQEIIQNSSKDMLELPAEIPVSTDLGGKSETMDEI